MLLRRIPGIPWAFLFRSEPDAQPFLVQHFAASAPKGQTSRGSGVTRHGVNQKRSREVRTADELDAIKSPPDTRPVVVDQLSRPSQRVVGQVAEVVRNPSTGKIVSADPTSTKKAERLMRKSN